MTIWDYIYVGSIITIGLIFATIGLVEFCARQQEKRARRRTTFLYPPPINRRKITAEDIRRLQKDIELKGWKR